MVNKSSEQVLNDCHDDGNDALRTIGAGGTPASPESARDTDTGSGAIDFTTAIATKWRPSQVNIHATATVNDPLTVKFKSKTGAGYETLLYSFPAGWTDLVWSPDNNRLYDSGDELHIECANVGGATISTDVLGEEA